MTPSGSGPPGPRPLTAVEPAASQHDPGLPVPDPGVLDAVDPGPGDPEPAPVPTLRFAPLVLEPDPEVRAAAVPAAFTASRRVAAVIILGISVAVVGWLISVGAAAVVADAFWRYLDLVWIFS